MTTKRMRLGVGRARCGIKTGFTSRAIPGAYRDPLKLSTRVRR